MGSADWFWLIVLVVPPLLGPLAWFFGADSRASGGWSRGSFIDFPRPGDRPDVPAGGRARLRR